MFDLRHFEEVQQDFQKVWGYLQSLDKDGEAYKDIAEFRVYRNPKMLSVLKEVGFVKVPSDIDLIPLKELLHYKELGLESKSGNCLLGGRYAFPVRDFLGNILALIGWFPDFKKYITTPSRYFKRSALFFGMEQANRVVEEEEFVFICEGIFDALTLRSLGYRAYATMGVDVGREKKLLYPLLGKRLVGISDRDIAGKKVRDIDKWGIGQYLTWGDEIKNAFDEDGLVVKDIDDFAKLFDNTEIVKVFNEAILNSKDRIIKL